MSYLVGLLIAAVVAAFYFKKKASDAALDAKLGKIRGRDKELSNQQKDIEGVISELDKGIKKVKDDRKRERDKRANESKEERADKWN